MSPPGAPVAPAPASGNYTYKYCSGSDCDQCQSYSFPQGACIDNSEEGTSFRATCTNGGQNVVVTFFESSTRCGGSRSAQTIQSNTCYRDGSATVQYNC